MSLIVYIGKGLNVTVSHFSVSFLRDVLVVKLTATVVVCTKSLRSMKPKGPDPNKQIVDKCIEMIRTFNPVTHSIDTWCLEHLGDVTSPDAKPENVLIQQIVYGWSKEKAVLKVCGSNFLIVSLFVHQCFINDFYADNGSRVLRTDITLYTIFAYLAIFRLEELGVPKFKALALTQEPLKITTFIVYLFDKVKPCVYCV